MKALFICGSLNQTKMMFEISEHLPQFDPYFTPYYCDGFLKPLQKSGLLDFTVMGGRHFKKTVNYLEDQGVNFDYEGREGPYELVVTCSDLLIQKNIRNSKLVLVQEGMTDPENFAYHMVKWLGFPRWVGSTATTGLSDAYDIFCVASEGYRELFIKKGIDPKKIRVTGIPNFDNCKSYLDNEFPHNDFVLVATSDRRETYNYENRKKFIDKANRIADGRQIIFKFHPNENFERATREVSRHSPYALTFNEGNTEHMIANCCALVTRFSSVVFVGIALEKEVYSDFEMSRLRCLLPMQNEGRSAENIASECLKLFAD